MTNRRQCVGGVVREFSQSQFWLEVGQVARLKAQARSEGRHIVDLVRDAIDALLFRENHYVAQIVLDGEEHAMLRGLVTHLNVSCEDSAAEKLLREAIRSAYAHKMAGDGR